MHPDIREYSWFSPGANNGFRLDYAHATPELAQLVTASEFDQTPRLLRRRITQLSSFR
jgi:exonuclease III